MTAPPPPSGTARPSRGTSAPRDTSASAHPSTRPAPLPDVASSPARAYGQVAMLVAALALVPLLLRGSSHLLALAVAGLALACYGVALNLLLGLSGQLFLCLGALAGLAAYTSAALGDIGWPVAVAMLSGVALATAVGALLSWVAVRRRLTAILLGVVTLAASLVFHNLLLGARDLTGGETGRAVGEAGRGLATSRPAAYVALLALLAACLVTFRIVQRSRLGLACRALRDDPVAAELAGVDVVRSRVAVAAIGSAMLGAAGVLYAYQEGFVSPATFAFAHVDVRVLVAVSFGGLGTLSGPLAGAAVLAFVDEALRQLGQLRLAVYGAVLLALFLGLRRGAVPTLAGLLRLAREGRPTRSRSTRRR